jgi:2-dehydropantoate 2-reductase
MKFTIVGGGAIGGVAAGFLSRAGHDVSIVDKVGEHVAAINAAGLHLGGEADFTVRVPAISPSQLRAPLGAVILAVKAHDTEAAVSPVVPHLGQDEYVVSLQNGLEEYKLARMIGAERTVGAFLTFGAHYEAPGRVVYGGAGSLRLGELDGSMTPRLHALQDALSAIQPVELTDNIFGYLWGKEALGSIYFATALVDADVPDIFDNPRYQPILVDLCGETVRVAEALGVRIEAFDGFDARAMRFGQRDPRALEACWAGQRAYWGSHVQKRTGVWRDLAVRKRKSEAEALIGTIVREADAVGVPVPRNRAVLRLIAEIETGQRGFAWTNLEEIERAAQQAEASLAPASRAQAADA